jgi:hypothetical protein
MKASPLKLVGFFIYIGIYIMDNEKIKSSVEKYIDAIIVPKFPDIIKFSVENKSYDYSDYSVIKITFLMDGTEQEVEEEIEESVLDMFTMFSFNKNIKPLLKFETL